PPPMIATVVRRSDLIVRPVLRLGRARFALHHMVVHAGGGAVGGLGEQARDDGMNQASAARADEPRADRDRARSMADPAHAERTWMLEEHAVHVPRAVRSALSHSHSSPLQILVTPTGFEPVALRLGI